MIDLNTLIHAATFAKNDQGKPVVQIPVDIWDALLEQIEASKQTDSSTSNTAQRERWQAFMRDTADYEDDKSEAWWDEFDTFLKENGLNFPERDLKLGDE